MNANVYAAPKVLLHQQIRFETAQSWNEGKGNLPDNKGGNDVGCAPKKNCGTNPGRGNN